VEKNQRENYNLGHPPMLRRNFQIAKERIYILYNKFKGIILIGSIKDLKVLLF
jgi:hypothetical protein